MVTPAMTSAGILTNSTMTKTSFRIRPAILLFGDSITQQAFGVDGKVGWSSLLAASYSRRADVLNRGFSGYNTDHAIELLPRVFTGPIDTLFCTVFFGANDAALPGESQHVPIDTYEENLRTIVSTIREVMKDEFPILLITPPPVDEKQWSEFREIPKSDRENQVTRQYGQRMQKVAEEMKCCFVDTWTLLGGDSGDRGKYLSDGLHLNEDGNRLVYQGIMDCLKSNHPSVLPMADDDGDGKYGQNGIPLEEKVWRELC